MKRLQIKVLNKFDKNSRFKTIYVRADKKEQIVLNAYYRKRRGIYDIRYDWDENPIDWKKEYTSWKNTVTRCPRSEFKKVFDVTPNFIVRTRRRYLNAKLEDVYEKYGRFAELDQSSWFVQWQRQEMREKIQKLKKKLEFTTTKKLTEATFDISSIKRVPIGSIIEVDCSGKALCPFHNDSTPSLYIYKEDNRFHCFSCGANGDVIDLYMELNNCNFYNACKALTI